MKVGKIQLIPKLLALETNVNQINCFSFGDLDKYKNFFDYNPQSPLHFSYKVINRFSIYSKKVTLQFSNILYNHNLWFYRKKLFFTELKFLIDEKRKYIESNSLYHKLFIKIGWLEPIGCILTDYITYELEKIGKIYHAGAAANFRNTSFLFLGEGRNFKTTLVSKIVQNGGYYITQEFLLLDKNMVYATIPPSNRFDFRKSHNQFKTLDIRTKKVDVSEYEVVIFLFWSSRNKIYEIEIQEANKLAALSKNSFNSYYYRFFKAKDVILKNKVVINKDSLQNKNARYFVAYFTDINYVYKFIKGI